MSRRTLFVLATAVVVTASTVGAGMALAGEDAAPRGPVGGGGAIQTRGTERIEPNELIYSTFHFSPEKAVVDSGQQLRWVHNDQAEDPHTATIVEHADLPTDFVGDLQLPRLQPGAAGALRRRGVEAKGRRRRRRRAEQAGRLALFFAPDRTSPRQVTARPGTKLFYLCAIHPWMQGKIVVG